MGDRLIDIVDADYGRLIEVLKEHRYDETKVIPIVKKEVPGPSEILFFFHYHFSKKNSFFMPTFFVDYYQRDFKIKNPYVFTLFELFAKNVPVPIQDLKSFIAAEDVDSFINQGFLVEENGRLRSKVRILPFFDLYIFIDPYDRSIKDYTYFGMDSVDFAEDVRSTLAGQKFRRSLDIGTGSGVQALNVAHLSEDVNGIDINPRAIRFGQTNARVNNIGHAKFFESNLYESVNGKFDLVTSNPPFIFYPDDGYDPLTFRDGHGGKWGLELSSAILNGLDDVLEDNGMAKMICVSLMIKGHDTFVEEVKKIFSEKNYKVTIRPFKYFMRPNYFRFHRKHDVAYNIFYILTLKKGSSYAFHMESMNPIAKFFDFMGVGFIYVYFYARRIFGFDPK